MTAPERAGRAGDTQPMPTPRAGVPDVQAEVIADIRYRRQVGIKRYGTPLQPNNGRNALVDAYEETLDLACYLKQRILEEAAATTGVPQAEPRVAALATHILRQFVEGPETEWEDWPELGEDQWVAVLAELRRLVRSLPAQPDGWTAYESLAAEVVAADA